MNISDFWNAAYNSLIKGEAIIICFVVDQTKGSPGTSAARMFVDVKGKIRGTIGGGIMERRVIDRCVERLKKGVLFDPKLEVLEHRENSGSQSSGLICGGSQTNLELALTSEKHVEIAKEISKAASDGTGSLIFSHNKMELVEETVEKTVLTKYDKSNDDWKVMMPLSNHRRIVVFGGGHCGVALSNTMQRLDYDVTIVESREGLSTLKGLNKSVKRIITDFEKAEQYIKHKSNTIAIVMTYSMASDILALSGIIDKDFKWIGLMGSQSKITRIKNKLREQGFSDLQINKIVVSVGIGFNSDTPEEIAVSIAAKILHVREKGDTI